MNIERRALVDKVGLTTPDATYALANSMNGNAVAAAEYAAYSKTYGFGGYAVNDLDSYQEDYSAQVAILKELLVRI